MNFQSIISFLLSPMGIIIIVGVFSTLGRIAKSAQEQQAKKKALAKMRSDSRDALRTGARPGTEPTPQASINQTSTAQASSTQSQPAPKPSTWDQKQDLRKQRIQRLREQQTQRLELAKQRRQGAANPQSTQGTQRPGQRVGAPNQRQPAQRQPAQRPALQPPQPAPHASQQRRREQANAQAERQRRVSGTPTTPLANTPVTSAPIANAPVTAGSLVGDASGPSATTPQSVRRMIRSDLKRAIISKEVFGTPLGLRPPGSETTGAN